MEVSEQNLDPAILPKGKGPRYPLDTRLGGPQSPSERSDVVVTRKTPEHAGNQTPVIQSIASHHTDWDAQVNKRYWRKSMSRRS
jgi:hypothetical protein